MLQLLPPHTDCELLRYFNTGGENSGEFFVCSAFFFLFFLLQLLTHKLTVDMEAVVIT